MHGLTNLKKNGMSSTEKLQCNFYGTFCYRPIKAQRKDLCFTLLCQLVQMNSTTRDIVQNNGISFTVLSHGINQTTRRHIPDDGLHSYHRDKVYNVDI